jgi:hypothetical protein
VLKTRLEAAIRDGSLPYRVVLLLDTMSDLSYADYKELSKLLTGRELHIVSLYGSDLAQPSSRVTSDVPSGRLKALADADIIEFCVSGAEGDMLCADRIHLTEEGNAALARLLAERLALKEE